MNKPAMSTHTGVGPSGLLSDLCSEKTERKQVDGTDIGRDYTEGEERALLAFLMLQSRIHCSSASRDSNRTAQCVMLNVQLNVKNCVLGTPWKYETCLLAG